MMSCMSMLHYSVLALKFSYFWVDSMLIQVFVMFQIVVSWIVIPVGWSVVLFEARKFLCLGSGYLFVAHEVKSREETIVGDHVITRMGLLIVEMSKGSHVFCAKVKRDEGISIVDSIEIFSIQVS